MRGNTTVSDNQKTLQCKLVCKSLKYGRSSSNKSQEGGGDTQRPRGAAAQKRASCFRYWNTCGRKTHSKHKICPGTKCTCNKCKKKKGYWQRMCKTKAVREITEEIENALFLGADTKENK